MTDRLTQRDRAVYGKSKLMFGFGNMVGLKSWRKKQIEVAGDVD